MTLLHMAGHLIRRLQQQSTALFQTTMKQAGYDLTSVQFAAMQLLEENAGIEQAQIAEMIAYDRATIGGVIERLEKKGYVSRTVSPQDRRAREVRLTREGQQVLNEVYPLVEALQRDILHGLSDDEQQAFLALARKAVMKTE
ncbi:MAG: MarR family transcriptional regulator [Thiolinea sp.]